MACFKGHPSIVKYLIKNGSNIDSLDIFGRTPFDWAEEEQKIWNYELSLTNQRKKYQPNQKYFEIT